MRFSPGWGGGKSGSGKKGDATLDRVDGGVGKAWPRRAAPRATRPGEAAMLARGLTCLALGLLAPPAWGASARRSRISGWFSLRLRVTRRSRSPLSFATAPAPNRATGFSHHISNRSEFLRSAGRNLRMFLTRFRHHEISVPDPLTEHHPASPQVAMQGRSESWNVKSLEATDLAHCGPI